MGWTYKDYGIRNDVSWLVLSPPELSTQYLADGEASQKNSVDRKFLHESVSNPGICKTRQNHGLRTLVWPEVVTTTQETIITQPGSPPKLFT